MEDAETAPTPYRDKNQTWPGVFVATCLSLYYLSLPLFVLCTVNVLFSIAVMIIFAYNLDACLIGRREVQH